jgi:FkbM family methyltransferase
METDNGRFLVDPVSGFGALLSQGSYEPDLVMALWSLLEPGATFVDVGANEGYFSVIASTLVGSAGRVIAVEPQQRLRNVLERNFDLNDIRNVTVVDRAISNTRASATLHLSPDMNTGSTALRQTTAYSTEQVQVDTMTLSDLVHDYAIDRIDLMKMDIEGFEYEAILGSPELFREQRIKALALELHPRALVARGHTAEGIVHMLKSYGYRIDLRFEHSITNAIWTAEPQRTS